jgi:FkbM family methyltransferase
MPALRLDIVGRLKPRLASEARFVGRARAPHSERDLHRLAIKLRDGTTTSARILSHLPYLRISRRARSLIRSSEATIESTSIGSADYLRYCLARHRISHSQLLQELLVLFLLGEDSRGYAVEFGAGAGVARSNSYLREKRNWDTLVAEPARSAQDSVRRHCRGQVDLRCVRSRSGEQLEFVEPANQELPTLSDFVAHDHHAEVRAATEIARYLVETVSLSDLLLSHQAPRVINYLSVDTEGSEFEILSHFNFDEYMIKIITVEHNGVAENRTQIHQLLMSNGFVRVFDHLSQIEDWYVYRDALPDIDRN